MIIVDTSVWIDHFRGVEKKLALLLEARKVRQHPFVTGELCMGNLDPWRETVTRLESLPQVTVVYPEALYELVERERLNGTGVGFVDSHLLASALHDHSKLWTRDRRLLAVSRRLAVAFEE